MLEKEEAFKMKYLLKARSRSEFHEYERKMYKHEEYCWNEWITGFKVILKAKKDG